MNEKNKLEKIPIGTKLGMMEITVNKEIVDDYIKIVQWGSTQSTVNIGIAPPGIGFDVDEKILMKIFSESFVAIWAKSEQEYFKPLIIGSKIYMRGKLVDKYVKHGKTYFVTEFETRDENGELLLRSRETGVSIQ